MQATMRIRHVVVALVLAACGSGVATDAGTSVDAGTSIDAGPGIDSSTPVDSGVAVDSLDAGADAGPVDASLPRIDANGTCHPYPLGGDEIAFRMVTSLPAMTGGTIPSGTYDAVDVQTMGSISGSYRATWVFEDATTLQQVQRLTLLSPSTITPRTFTWSTSGATLSRTETCPDENEFESEYRVRTEGDDVFLDVRQGTLMFTFRRR